MTDILFTIFVAALVTIANQVAYTYIAPWIEDKKRLRAFKRLMNEPLLAPGRYKIDLYTPNHGQCIAKDSVVRDISVGRVEFAWTNDAGEPTATSFTGQEVENLIWVARDPGSPTNTIQSQAPTRARAPRSR